jgi:cytoskeletal protein CcmA (bactofilin family)
MWNRKSEPTPQRPPNGAPNGAATQNTSAAVATAPPPPVAPPRVPEPVSKATAIGAGVSIIGEVYSEEDLFIDGKVQGKLDVKDSKLTIGPKGEAKSNVKAREVIIHGKVQGDVEASQKITIKKDGSLVGNIKTTGIVIDDDAYFKGSIDIVRKEG